MNILVDNSGGDVKLRQGLLLSPLRASGGISVEYFTHRLRSGLRPSARCAGYDAGQVTQKGRVKRREDWRWSSYNSFALDEATVVAYPIQIDDVRFLLGYRA